MQKRIRPNPIDAQAGALDRLVDAFAAHMKQKLRAKISEKRGDWWDDHWDPKQELIRHIEKGDPIDIANFAAFWWNHELPSD